MSHPPTLAGTLWHLARVVLVGVALGVLIWVVYLAFPAVIG